MSLANAEEETLELLPNQNDDGDESYFIEYAMQKEIINRNRVVTSRRLLSQSGAQNPEGNSTNTNQQLPKVIFLFHHYINYLFFILILFYFIIKQHLYKLIQFSLFFLNNV